MGQARKLIPVTTHRGDFRRKRQMSKAMELIVQVYVRHQNRRALEDLGKHRQKLALELRAPGHGRATTSACLVRQINEEIAVIEAGLEQLVIEAKAA